MQEEGGQDAVLGTGHYHYHPVSGNVIRQHSFYDQEIKRVQTRNIWGKTFAMFNWSLSGRADPDVVVSAESGNNTQN